MYGMNLCYYGELPFLNFDLVTSKDVSTLRCISSICARLWCISIIFLLLLRWLHLWLILLPSKMLLMNPFSRFHLPNSLQRHYVLSRFRNRNKFISLLEKIVINTSMMDAWIHIFSVRFVSIVCTPMCVTLHCWITVELERRDKTVWIIFSCVANVNWISYCCTHTDFLLRRQHRIAMIKRIHGGWRREW